MDFSYSPNEKRDTGTGAIQRFVEGLMAGPLAIAAAVAEIPHQLDVRRQRAVLRATLSEQQKASDRIVSDLVSVLEAGVEIEMAYLATPFQSKDAARRALITARAAANGLLSEYELRLRSRVTSRAIGPP